MPSDCKLGVAPLSFQLPYASDWGVFRSNSELNMNFCSCPPTCDWCRRVYLRAERGRFAERHATDDVVCLRPCPSSFLTAKLHVFYLSCLYIHLEVEEKYGAINGNTFCPTPTGSSWGRRGPPRFHKATHPFETKRRWFLCPSIFQQQSILQRSVKITCPPKLVGLIFVMRQQQRALIQVRIPVKVHWLFENR